MEHAVSRPLSGVWAVIAPPRAHVTPPAEGWGGALERNGAAAVVLEVDGVAADRASLVEQLTRTVAGSVLAGVLSFLALDERPREDFPVVTAGLATTVLLAQALGDAGVKAPLWCVSRRAVAVDGQDELQSPLQAQVWGLGRVAALEQPERWGGLLDLGVPWDRNAARAFAAILDSGEDQVALRPSGAFARRVARAAPPEPAVAGSWRTHGTMLITGGTGGLGGHVARWAAKRGARHLVLASRSGTAAAGAGELEAELVALGARVTFEACDVTEPGEIERVLADVPARYPLTAVVHAAGVDRYCAFEAADTATLAASIAPKVAGAASLDRLLQDEPLDLFAVFSSIAGVWGGDSLAPYAAANAYLDALVTRRRSTGRAGTALAWGPWAKVGMAAYNPGLTGQLARVGLAAMEPEQAMSAFEQAVDGGDTAVAIADVDWERFGLAYTYSRPSPLLSDLLLEEDGPR
jgi:NAD(P)-dependent dehydrogenase (short-subunit alcohol dehydrogenase family)